MAQQRNYWLVKSEPGAYSWDDLVQDGETYWDGVRNYEARNNMRSMSVGDRALYYHSGRKPAVVGVAEVTRGNYQDPTTDDERWCAVDVKPLFQLSQPVPLSAVKAEPRLAEMVLVRRSRLSVTRVQPEEYGIILEMGGVPEEPA